MVKRTIHVASLGTYFAPGAETNGAVCVNPMRSLVYWAKDDPEKPRKPETIVCGKPPDRQQIALRSPADAYDTIARMWCGVIDNPVSRAKFLQVIGMVALDLASDGPLVLVPVPSSVVTRENIDTARWPAREIARRLAERGFGRLVIGAVNRQARTSKTKGGRRYSAQELASNLDVLWTPGSNHCVLYVDDQVHRGRNLVALEHELTPHQSAAITLSIVASTSDAPVEDCFHTRASILSFDYQASPWQHSLAPWSPPPTDA